MNDNLSVQAAVNFVVKPTIQNENIASIKYINEDLNAVEMSIFKDAYCNGKFFCSYLFIVLMFLNS